MPHHLLQLARTARLRHLVVWLLVVALPVHSLSGVLQRVLGASHRHAPMVAAAMAEQPLAPPSLQEGLRRLAASTVGPDVLALIDGDHARTQPQPHPMRIHASLGEPAFSEADLRQALATTPQEPDWQGPAAPSAGPTLRAHGHTHDGFQRHVHDAHDSTVIALGDKAGSDNGATGGAASATSTDAGGGTFPLPAASAAPAPAPALTLTAWLPLSAQPWRNHVSSPLERPPQA